MGKRYAGRGAAAVGTDVTLLTLISATTIRPSLVMLIIGSVATPADQALRAAILRFTAVGTEASGFTPTALDPADPASAADYGIGTFSVEPTYTANSHLLDVSVNQRATWTWYSQPRGEIKAPATANNGLGLRSLSATSTQVHTVTAHHED